MNRRLFLCLMFALILSPLTVGAEYYLISGETWFDTFTKINGNTGLLEVHRDNTENPHLVTKDQIELGEVTDDAQLKVDQLQTTITDDDTKIPSSGAVVDYVVDSGGGDMATATYDTDEDDIVDNSEALSNATLETILSSTDNTKIPSSKAVADYITSEGSGDMATSVYDIDTNDIVDNSEALSSATLETTITDDDTKIPSSGAVVDYVTSSGGGDMAKATYDTDEDDIVDNSEALSSATLETILTDTSDIKIPSSKAVADYIDTNSGDMEKTTYDTNTNDIVDNSEALSSATLETTLSPTDDTKIPSSKAVADYLVSESDYTDADARAAIGDIFNATGQAILTLDVNSQDITNVDDLTVDNSATFNSNLNQILKIDDGGLLCNDGTTSFSIDSSVLHGSWAGQDHKCANLIERINTQTFSSGERIRDCVAIDYKDPNSTYHGETDADRDWSNALRISASSANSAGVIQNTYKDIHGIYSLAFSRNYGTTAFAKARGAMGIGATATQYGGGIADNEFWAVNPTPENGSTGQADSLCPVQAVIKPNNGDWNFGGGSRFYRAMEASNIGSGESYQALRIVSAPGDFYYGIDMLEADITAAGIMMSSTNTGSIIGYAPNDYSMFNVAANRYDWVIGGGIEMSISASEISAQNNKITNLATPTLSTDAATKQYVDDNGGGDSYTDADARNAIGNIFGADGHADYDIDMDLHKFTDLSHIYFSGTQPGIYFSTTNAIYCANSTSHIGFISNSVEQMAIVPNQTDIYSAWIGFPNIPSSTTGSSGRIWKDASGYLRID